MPPKGLWTNTRPVCGGIPAAASPATTSAVDALGGPHRPRRGVLLQSGNVRRCSYIDADGEIVRVANSRAYNRWTKTFIENGRVYTEWAPYGADIAELIARNIAKTDADERTEENE